MYTYNLLLKNPLYSPEILPVERSMKFTKNRQ